MRNAITSLLLLFGCRGTPPEASPTEEPVELPDIVPATRWVGTAGLGGRTELAGSDAGDLNGDGLTEIGFGTAGENAWIIDGTAPSGSAFAHVVSELVTAPNDVTGFNVLGDLDGDGADDFWSMALFVGLNPLPPQVTANQAIQYPSQFYRPCDLNADGQADLCSTTSVRLGPLTTLEDETIIGACRTGGLTGRFMYALPSGWDEAILGSGGLGNDREVLFTLTWESAVADGLCVDSGSRYWTVPREAKQTNPTTADYTGDGITDFSATLHGDDLDPSDRAIYIVPGPGEPQDPNDPPDIREAPIRIAIPEDEHIWRVVHGDFDGDGFTDLLYSFIGQLRVYRGPFEPGTVPLDAADAVWRGDPGASSSFYRGLRVYDIDRDGQDDLLLWDDEDEDGGVNAGKITVVWSAGIGSGSRDDPL